VAKTTTNDFNYFWGMTKKELRIKYKNLRKSLTSVDISEKSLTIANKLLSVPIWKKEFYHVFLSISELNEVDTEFILHILQGKDKHILISRSDFETRQMTHFLLADNTKIRKNEYGIPEPIDGIAIDTQKIDVVFVPLLAFDDSGNRVGYGKGFYDKFLAECRPETIKIGLSFFDAVESWEDVFESDVKLDYCVTPNTVYTF
jgi:5-formyltetrahydrofolate cyclo-ligase